MSYGDTIQDILINDATIQSLVDTFIQSTNTYYMIFQGNLIPSDLTTDSGPYEPTYENKTINHYRASSLDGGQQVYFPTQLVVCRAYTQLEAEDIQDAVFSALNRVKSSDGKSFFVCSSLPVIPPADKTDNYNASVQVAVRTINC